MDLHQLLELTIQRNASDLHLVTGYYPTIRVDGELFSIRTAQLLTKEVAQQIMFSMLSDEQKESLAETVRIPAHPEPIRLE